MQAFNSPNIMNQLIFEPFQIKNRNQWYRFLSSGFLHGDWIHLAINMFVLYSFGSVVENYYGYFFGTNGIFMYGLLYLSSIVAASARTYYKEQNNPEYRALGASGAVSAVLFTSVLFQPTQAIYIYGVLPIPGIVGAVLYLIYSSYASRKLNDHINHDAHFYGAIYGIIFTLVFKPEIFQYFLKQF